MKTFADAASSLPCRERVGKKTPKQTNHEKQVKAGKSCKHIWKYWTAWISCSRCSNSTRCALCLGFLFFGSRAWLGCASLQLFLETGLCTAERDLAMFQIFLLLQEHPPMEDVMDEPKCCWIASPSPSRHPSALDQNHRSGQEAQCCT